MIARGVSSELVELGHTTFDRMAADMPRGGGYAQLIASVLYEALHVELDRTPQADAARRRLLAAAADRCRRSAAATTSASVRLAQLRAAVTVLETATLARPAPPSAARARFTVIQGGLAKTA